MTEFRLTLLAIAAWVLLGGSAAALRAPFLLAGHSVGPGERADIDLHVPAAASDPATDIPITIFMVVGGRLV